MQAFWAYLFSAVYLTAAGAVTVHAVHYKRNVRAVIAWVGLVWLAPVIGPIAYICFGINRIQWMGISLQLTSVWKHQRDMDLTESERERQRVVLAEHPGLAGFASLGFELTNRPLLPGNRITPLIDGDEAYPRMLEAIRGTECYDEELAAHLTAIAEAKRKESKPLTLEAM